MNSKMMSKRARGRPPASCGCRKNRCTSFQCGCYVKRRKCIDICRCENCLNTEAAAASPTSTATKYKFQSVTLEATIAGPQSNTDDLKAFMKGIPKALGAPPVVVDPEMVVDPVAPPAVESESETPVLEIPVPHPKITAEREKTSARQTPEIWSPKPGPSSRLTTPERQKKIAPVRAGPSTQKSPTGPSTQKSPTRPTIEEPILPTNTDFEITDEHLNNIELWLSTFPKPRKIQMTGNTPHTCTFYAFSTNKNTRSKEMCVWRRTIRISPRTHLGWRVRMHHPYHAKHFDSEKTLKPYLIKRAFALKYNPHLADFNPNRCYCRK